MNKNPLEFSRREKTNYMRDRKTHEGATDCSECFDCPLIDDCFFHDWFIDNRADIETLRDDLLKRVQALKNGKTKRLALLCLMLAEQHTYKDHR